MNPNNIEGLVLLGKEHRRWAYRYK
jgi:hypothetical protein